MSPEKMKPIFVILVTYNGERDLPLFLSSFREYTNPSDAVLVVVDNASTDRSRDIIRESCPEVVLFEGEENTGFTGGNNRGVAYALAQGAEYVFLANQDLVFQAGWLAPLREIMDANPSIGALQPLIAQYPDTERINSYGDSLHYLGFGYARGNGVPVRSWPFAAEVEEVAYCSFSAVCLRAHALKKVGLFDEDFFMYHEDSDLCWRLRLAGYRCAATNRSRVSHHYEFTRSIKKFELIERNRFLNLLRNYRVKTLVLIAPMLLFWEAGLLFVSAFGFLFMKKTIGIREKLRAYSYFFSRKNWRRIRLHRRAIQQTRIVPDSEIIRLFVARIEFQEVKNPILELIANPLTEWYWRLIRKRI